MKYIVYEYDELISVHNSASLAYSAYDNKTQYVKSYKDEEVESIQRNWRNSELKKTDFIPPIVDYAYRSDFLDYRTELRNWPLTSSLFPNIRPTGSDSITGSLNQL